jgi:hypothetical protein
MSRTYVGRTLTITNTSTGIEYKSPAMANEPQISQPVRDVWQALDRQYVQNRKKGVSRWQFRWQVINYSWASLLLDLDQSVPYNLQWQQADYTFITVNNVALNVQSIVGDSNSTYAVDLQCIKLSDAFITPNTVLFIPSLDLVFRLGEVTVTL